jgi:hypothetical protein
MSGSNGSRCPTATEVDVRQQQKSRVISVFRCDVNETFVLLGRYTALIVVLKRQEWFGALRLLCGLLYGTVSISPYGTVSILPYGTVSISPYDDKVFLSTQPRC